MHTSRRHIPGLVLASVVLFPGGALAAQDPQPTPTPTSSQVAAPPSSLTPAPALDDDAFTVWHGMVREGGAYRRAAPTGSAVIDEELDPGTPIRIDRWVGGSMLYPDVITWGAVDAADGGGYIFGGSLEGLLPPAPPPPADYRMDSSASWIDVNLTLNVVTTYLAGQPTRSMLTSPGRPGHETDTGRFAVRTKLGRQNMAGPGYFVPGVPNVEYFFGAEALHGRYWTLPDVVGVTSADVDDNGRLESVADDTATSAGGPNRGVAFGVPSSHGCLGLQVDDAAWLYGLTVAGMAVDVHY